MSDRFAGRSVHGAPRHAQDVAANPILRIEGLVERSLELASSDLSALEHVRFLDLVTAETRGHWPATDWSGVPILKLIDLAGPAVGSVWIEVLGGPLGTAIAIHALDKALLCDRIADEAIHLDNGGPFRLVCPDIPYNLCVKWVDRIIVSVDEPDRSVERVAAARQRARDAKQP